MYFWEITSSNLQLIIPCLLKFPLLSFVVVLVYVDDIMIAFNVDDDLIQLQAILRFEFKIKDFGPFRFFHGLEISRYLAGISVC